MFLRILLPYLYRELRQNGGAVDRVIFAVIGYTEEAQSKLKNFVTAANGILKDEAFQFLYLKEDPSPPYVPGARHLYPFYRKFYRLQAVPFWSVRSSFFALGYSARPRLSRKGLLAVYKFYYVVLQRLLRNPSDVYFKVDDDIVYVHPNVFGSMINNKDTSECFLHYAGQHRVQLEMQLASSEDWRL